MDKHIDENTSKHFCCVPQCKSRNTKEISLIKFPRDENLRKKWAEKLKIDENVTKNLYVCSLHFLPTDFQASGCSSIRHRVKRGAIPSKNIHNIPLKSLKKTIRKKLKENSLNDVRTRKKINKRPTKSPDDSDDEALTCKEILRRCVNRNNASGSSRRNSFSKAESESPQRAQKEDPVEPFVFVDVSQIKESLEKKTSPPSPAKHQPNILKNRKFGSISPSKTPNIRSTKNPGSKTIGIQTEKIDSELEFEKVRFSKNIEFLRKRLLGHALKIKGNIFRINECSISFKNEDKHSEEISKLIIQPDNLISSGELFLNSILESCESDRVPKSTKTSQQLCNDSIRSHHPMLPQNPVPAEHNYTLKKDFIKSRMPRDTPIRNNPRGNEREKSVHPLFDKDVRVKLNKLPDDLLDASRKGHRIRVETEEFPQKGSVLRKYTIKVIRNVPVAIQCEKCDKKFPTSDALNEHMKVHVDLKATRPLSKEDEPRVNSIEVVNQPKASTPHLDGKDIICDICHRKFQHNHSLLYHKKIVHGKKEEHMSTPKNLPETEKKQDEKEKIIDPEEDHTKVGNTIEVVNQESISEATDSEEKHFNCPLCNRRFKYYHSYSNHLRIIHDWSEDRYTIDHHRKEDQKLQENTCPECPCMFRSTKELERHLLDKHQTVLKKPMYDCNICKKVFITYRSLMYHLEKTHDTTINKDVLIKYRCGTCKKLFEIDYYYKSNHEKECKGESTAKDAEGKVSKPDGAILDKSPTAVRQESIYSQNKSSETHNNEKHQKCISEEERNIKRKKSEDVNNAEKKQKSEENEILNRLKDLLGSTDGPNDITIVNIDE